MSSEELHAPRERLSDTTVATHQAIVSSTEELEAMDWYRNEPTIATTPTSLQSSSTT